MLFLHQNPPSWRHVFHRSHMTWELHYRSNLLDENFSQPAGESGIAAHSGTDQGNAVSGYSFREHISFNGSISCATTSSFFVLAAFHLHFKAFRSRFIAVHKTVYNSEKIMKTRIVVNIKSVLAYHQHETSLRTRYIPDRAIHLNTLDKVPSFTGMAFLPKYMQPCQCTTYYCRHDTFHFHRQAPHFRVPSTFATNMAFHREALPFN